MTIENLQERVDEWIKTYGGGYFSELTNLGILLEECGEMARWLVRKYGDQNLKPSEKNVSMDHEIADEMSDIIWVLVCLANQMDINLTEEIEKNISKKTSRDKDRHIPKSGQ